MAEKQTELLNELYEKKTTAGDIMKNYIIDFAVIIILIVYLARTIATIGVANKTILELLADGGLIFFFAVSIASLMQKKGLLEGQKDTRFIKTLNEYGESIEKTTPFIENLDSFCDEKNLKNLEKIQAKVLRKYGISLESYKNGFIDPLTEKQQNALDEINKIKIHELTTQELVSENEEIAEKFTLGKTQVQYVRQKNLFNWLLTALTALILGYFSLKLVQEFSWATFVWALVQVVFFIVKAAMSYASAFLFTVNDFRNRIINKTSILYEFYNIEIKKEININDSKQSKNKTAENGRHESGENSVGANEGADTTSEPNNELYAEGAKNTDTSAKSDNELYAEGTTVAATSRQSNF